MLSKAKKQLNIYHKKEKKKKQNMKFLTTAVRLRGDPMESYGDKKKCVITL